jgi:hypothetical protein
VCEGRNCAKCAGPQEGCATCDDGFYAYPNNGLLIGGSTFNLCFRCEELNCAAGGCTDSIGASTNLMSCACNRADELR